MFDGLIASMFHQPGNRVERMEGIAFLKAAASLYELIATFYVGLNIPVLSQPGTFRHCSYSNARATQRTTDTIQSANNLDRFGLLSDRPLTKLKGLGFIGIMVQGAHHQLHHLLMAKGEFMH